MLRLRQLLFWLLVLVIPLQGLAATSKLLCIGARDVHGHGATDAHGPGQAHSHQRLAMPESPAPTDADPAVVAAAEEDAAHHCGLCAACCHGFAVGDAYQSSFASPVRLADAPEMAARIPSRAVRLPEKPPRA